MKSSSIPAISTKATYIRQVNRLLESRQSLSLQAKRLMYFLIHHIQRSDSQPHIIELSYRDFLDYITEGKEASIKGAARYDIIAKLESEVGSQPIRILVERELDEQEKKTKFVYKSFHWFKSITIDGDKMKIELNELIIPIIYFTRHESYTKVAYRIGQYGSVYTIRIKEILEKERFKQKAFIDMELSELRTLCGLTDKYKKAGDFKKRVIDQAKEELDGDPSAVVRFTYTFLNKSREEAQRYWHYIRFFPVYLEKSVAEIPKAVTKNFDLQTENPDAYDLVYELWGLSESKLSYYEKTVKLSYFMEKVSYVKTQANVVKPAGLLIKALDEDYMDEKTRRQIKDFKRIKAKHEKDRQISFTEEEINTLKDDFYEAKRSLVIELISNNEEVKKEVFETSKSHSIFRMALKNKKVNYNNIMEGSISAQTIFVNTMVNVFPQNFENIYKEYEYKIRQKENHLEALQRKPQKYFLDFL